MLGFMQMSMFKKLLNSPSEAKVRNSIISEMRSGRISEDLNKCFIKFEDIEHHIEELKKKNRNADVLLDKGIALYEQGRIILLDGELTNYEEYKLPAFTLFIPMGDKLLFNINGMKKANWKKVGPDQYEYHFSNVFVELKFILVTAAIMYAILNEGKEKEVFNDKKLMPTITNIYVDFFKKALGRLGSSIDEWDKEKVNYIIAKFFYVHSLQFKEDQADKIVSDMYGFMDYELNDIKLSETNIDYSDLYTFVPSMTKVFYKKEIDAISLINAWANSFGSTVFTEVEYFPALLTHLLALVLDVDFVNQRYELRSRREIIYQRLSASLK